MPQTSWCNTRLACVLLALLCSPALTTQAADSEQARGSLSEFELNVTPSEEDLVYVEPVPASGAKGFVITGVGEYSYLDEQGRYFVDVLERDQAYLGVRITTPAGQPIVGAMPSIDLQGSSTLELSELTSAEDGVIRFRVVGGQMGLDTVTASIGETSIKFMINVISLRAAGFPELKSVEGSVGWSELMQARIEYQDFSMVATFPQSVQERSGKQVKINGFMLPLEPQLKQKRFLLTSNPPSCFFHIPGGPAGSIEVFAQEGIEASWDPILVEGRFEPQATSETGVVYQLYEARLVDQ